MTSLETCLREAVEKGGYTDIRLMLDWHLTRDNEKALRGLIICEGHRILLDPLFWQALGRARGWSDTATAGHGNHPIWLYHWHRFIDALAEGRTAGEFFSTLV